MVSTALRRHAVAVGTGASVWVSLLPPAATQRSRLLCIAHFFLGELRIYDVLVDQQNSKCPARYRPTSARLSGITASLVCDSTISITARPSGSPSGT